MVSPLLEGVVLGLSAGFSPGPLQTLVISQTLRHGTREGIKVSLAPILTDLPIILACAFLLAKLSHLRPVLGLITLAGAVYVLRLSYANLRTTGLSAREPAAQVSSLGKGAIVNALNPHPYLFWLTIGGPILVKAWRDSSFGVAGFLVGFYACLVGSKILLAALAASSKRFLNGGAHVRLLQALGVLLLCFALLLFKEGWSLMQATG